MAERRMFSKKVVDSDIFLDMPLSTQCLYFHLALRADDDGFVNKVKRIMRMIGSNDDDLRILISKDFVKPFESGLIVITHWKVHNYIQKDRYRPTEYPEKLLLTCGRNGIYELISDAPKDDKLSIPEGNEPKCIQDVSETDTERIQVVSIGKDRDNEGKQRDNITNIRPSDDEQNSISSLKSDFERCWNEYPRKCGKKKAFEAFKRSIKRGATVEEILTGIQYYKEDIAAKQLPEQYIKMGSTFFQGECWTDEYGVYLNKPDYSKEKSDIDGLDDIQI